MVEVAIRSPVRSNLDSCDPESISPCLCIWFVEDGSDELVGTLGKGTESLLLGDGDALLRFSGIAGRLVPS